MYMYMYHRTGEKGVELSKVYTHGEVAEHPSFWFAKNVIEKKYFECWLIHLLINLFISIYTHQTM